MKKPRVLTRCPANARTDRNERIIEFSFPGTGGSSGPLGGLISFIVRSDGTPAVQLYRVNKEILVTVSKEGSP